MADVVQMPASVAGPMKAVVAGLLTTNRSKVEVVLKIGWEATPDGTLVPVPLLTIRNG
ncbi:hypothetical protein [Streptomyces sp. NPDC057002]|uniref:hypothetical protein n=1 Tax=Streptomyces sp. NPDC057002 TaxID=3345992 RepID=UPI00363E6933